MEPAEGDERSAAAEVPVPDDADALEEVGSAPQVVTNGTPAESAQKSAAESGPPGILSAMPTQAKESEEKLNAVAALKAALQKAAAKPAVRRAECRELSDFCHCILSLSKASDAAPELAGLYEALPRIGEEVFVSLFGIRRAKKTSVVPKPTGSTSSGQKSTGRVKSYNTKKGFGFIDMPGFQRDIFVYNSHLVGRIGLMAGEAVEFELIMDGGRPQARQVKVISAPLNQAVEIPVGVQHLPMGGMVSAAPEANRGQSSMLNANPLGAMKQAMAMHSQPNTSPSSPSEMRELALAMAAAAAEVPTTLPPQKRLGGMEASPDKVPAGGEDLFEKIRNAQTVAATDKRQKMPKPGPDPISLAGPPGDFEDRQVPPGARSAMRGAYDNAAAEGESKFTDEGNIPRNASVRVVNFPATEVNDCLGVVQGFDAATARYSVAVDMRKGPSGAGGQGETVPLQLKEEYLHVEAYPAGYRAEGRRGPTAQKSATSAASQAPPALPGGTSQSEALRKSAAEALKRFGESAAAGQSGDQWLSGSGGQNPMMAAYHQQAASAFAMAQAAGKGFGKSPYPGYPPGPGFPGGPPRPQGPASGPGGMPQPFSQQMGGPGIGKGEASRTPGPQQMPGKSAGMAPALQPGAFGPRPGMPYGSPQSSLPGQQQQRPPASGPSQPPPQPKGLSLERAAFMTPGKQPGMPDFAKQPGVQASPAVPKPMTSMQAPAVPKQSGPPVSATPTSEGRPGARWRTLRSEKFNDIIVRETMEVASKTLRHINPGEVCVQRGQTMQMESGLVRMQIEPDGGWVTVHARNIQGPTFLEEIDGPSAALQPSTDIRMRQADAYQQPPQPAAQAKSKSFAVPSPSPDNVPMPQARPKAEPKQSWEKWDGKGSPPRERPGEGKGKSRGEDMRNIGGAQAKAASSKAKPIGAAPWQEGEDPWSKAVDPLAARDPWAKGGATDPWAAGAARQPGRQPPQEAGKGGKTSAPSRQRDEKSWGGNYPPPASSSSSAARYEMADFMRVRAHLLNNGTLTQPPPSLATMRILRLPNMESGERRSKRSDRERTAREDRDRDRDRRRDREDDGGGDGKTFLRDRGSTAARDSPTREARKSEAAADSVQQAAPAPRAGQATAASGGDASTASAKAPAVSGSEKESAKEEKKPPEESKANCRTQ